MIPLHLFEPRYVQLMVDLLASEKREMALGALLPGWEDEYFENPPVANVVGIGEILQHHQDDQGNFNIVLRGKCRAVVVDEQPSEKPYRIVQLEPQTEHTIAPGDAEAAHSGLLAAISSLADTTPQGAEELSVNYLADVLLVHLPISIERKLAVYCELNPLERVKLVLAEFEKQHSVGRSWPNADQTPEDPSWN